MSSPKKTERGLPSNPLVGLLRRFRHSSEKGQILILTGFMAVVLFGVIGLAVDVARMYAAKAELGRAVDAAALAGVLEFPDLVDAQSKAQDYLTANEPTATYTITPDGDNNRLVVNASKSLKMYFISVLGISTASISAHAAAGFGIVPVDAYLAIDSTSSMAGSPITQAKLAAGNFVDTLLTANNTDYTLVGAGGFRGCYSPPRTNPGLNANPALAPAAPPFGPDISVPIQFTALGSINNDDLASAPLLAPSSTPTKTPVPPTKTNTPKPPTATATKTNTPVPPTSTRTSTATATATATKTNTPVPPTATPDYSSNNECVRAQAAPSPQVANLTNVKSTLTTLISNLSAQGGSGTNVCLGVLMGQTVLFGPNHHTEDNARHILVVLSDGDNRWTGSEVYNNTWQPYPPGACTPDDSVHPPAGAGSPAVSADDGSNSCSATVDREARLDTETYNLATTMKTTQDVEVYVVAFGICRDTPGTYCDATKIGNLSYDDNTADQNLLKCMASSRALTNDHYFYASTAGALPGIFNQIAHQIGHRLIE